MNKVTRHEWVNQLKRHQIRNRLGWVDRVLSLCTCKGLLSSVLIVIVFFFVCVFVVSFVEFALHCIIYLHKWCRWIREVIIQRCFAVMRCKSSNSSRIALVVLWEIYIILKKYYKTDMENIIYFFSVVMDHCQWIGPFLL